MSVVSIAIILSFHLKDEPSDFELRMALPLGIVFWCLGLLCLVLGFGNYVKTMTLYSKRVALVQSGWKTQTVSRGHPGSYKGGADGVLDVWACSGEYCRRVYPVPGYEFDERFVIYRDKLMSTRLAILLRRLDGWEFYMRGDRDTIPWCGHLLMTGYTEQRLEQYTQYFIALDTEVLLWFCERCAKNLYKRHRYSILSYESPNPPLITFPDPTFRPYLPPTHTQV